MSGIQARVISVSYRLIKTDNFNGMNSNLLWLTIRFLNSLNGPFVTFYHAIRHLDLPVWLYNILELFPLKHCQREFFQVAKQSYLSCMSLSSRKFLITIKSILVQVYEQRTSPSLTIAGAFFLISTAVSSSEASSWFSMGTSFSSSVGLETGLSLSLLSMFSLAIKLDFFPLTFLSSFIFLFTLGLSGEEVEDEGRGIV